MFGAIHEAPDLRGLRRDLNFGKLALYQLFTGTHTFITARQTQKSPNISV